MASEAAEGGEAYPVIGGMGARLAESDLRVVVTGAGGWLGLATLEMLRGLLGEAFHRRVICFGAAGRTFTLRGGAAAAQLPIAALADLRPAPSLVLHLAFLTQGPQMSLTADEYVETNQALSRWIISCLDPMGAQAVFVASSGAVHLADRNGGPQSKGLYGWLKREDELAFDRWRRESGKTAVIGRVFNLSGPYINRRSTYALACFIADALAGRPITIRATGRVYRSYTSVEELMSIVFGVLTGPTGETITFETAGEATHEMAEIALAVTRTLDAGQVVSRPPIREDEPIDRYVGDGVIYKALSRELGAPSIDLAGQIRQTARYMMEYPEGL